MTGRQTPLLDKIHTPDQLRGLSASQLPMLAEELRYDVIRAVSQTGGHLGAGLGVVELTIALHYVFDTPSDRLIWDVGHQAYPHRYLPDAGIRCLVCARKAGCPVSPKDLNLPMTRLGQGILQPLFQQVWAWRSRVICKAATIMSLR